MNMRKIIMTAAAFTLALGLFSGCGDTPAASGDPSQKITPGKETSQALEGVIKTGGSTSVEKVMNALIYQFQEDNRQVTVNYEMNGSGDGIKNTLSGMYQIGHSSRELKTDGSENGLKAIPYAIDGIAVVLHKENAVSDLNTEQLKEIYTGKIKNWKEVGGEDALITVVIREASSGTRSAFAEIVGLEKKDDTATSLIPSATTCDSTGAVQTTVSQNKNAIGYMSYSDVDTEKVKPSKYNGVEISTSTLKDNVYKLKREFLLITKEEEPLSSPAQAFIEFILSDAGQRIVADNKLLPIK